jgi:hypothetical protein
MSIVPPASATLIWAFPTPYEEVRCLVWEHGPAGYIIAIMFGQETLALETAPTRWAMEAGVDLVWRGLLASGLGKEAAHSKTLAAMSESPGDAQDQPLEMPRMSETIEALKPRRLEDPFSPHMPFRHPEPSLEHDIESSDPPPRRRPH